MKTMTVDKFAKTKVSPEFRPIVALLRQLLKKYAPEAQEVIAYAIPAYKANRIFVVINPNKQGITFSFSRGAQFEDKYGLLRGVGKSSRHVKLKNLADANTVALRYYIRQALKFDAR